MEKCKFCQAELEEGNAVCPACGKDNEKAAPECEEVTAPQETEEVAAPQDAQEQTVSQEAEEKAVSREEEAEEPVKAPESGEKAVRPGPGKIALAVVAVIALVAVLAALVISGMDKSVLMQDAPATDPVEITDPAAPTIEESTSFTIPDDGNPDDETCKGNYSASDEEVIAAADTVVATAGSHELTLGQLQIYYWQEVGGFLNRYGSYAASFGLDVNIPLYVQECTLLEGRTWQQYFLMRALNSWQTYVALDDIAGQENHALEQEYLDILASLPENMEEEAKANGFNSAQLLMEYNVGVGSTVDEYVDFMETYYHGYSYYTHFSGTVTASEEEIEEMFALHEEEYAANGLTKDTKTVNVRHILLYPEGATSETVFSETFPEEAWTASEAAAQAMLDQWLAEDGTEEGFAALATANTQDPGSKNTGGLYTGVQTGQMVEAFDAWCFDPARQVGDTGVVRTNYGYHIMYYSGETILWPSLVAEDVKNDKINKMVESALEQFPLTVDYSKILLSQAAAFAR